MTLSMNRAFILIERGASALIIGFIFIAGLALTFPDSTQFVQTHLRAFFSSNQNGQAMQAQQDGGVREGQRTNETIH